MMLGLNLNGFIHCLYSVMILAEEARKRAEEARRRAEEARKKAEEERKRKEELERKLRNRGWRCNAYGATHHGGPNECSNPSLGGHWVD